MRELLLDAARRAAAYLEGLDARRVSPAPEALAGLSRLGETFPAGPSDPAQVLRVLDEIGSPASVASAGGRYSGFVIGGSLPAALAANWLAGAWDQEAGLAVAGPGCAALESVSLRWLLDALSLPSERAAGFVTGATMANFTGLAAARHAVLQERVARATA